MRENGPNGPHRTRQIRRERIVPIGIANRKQLAPAVKACIVNEDVDATPFVNHRSDGGPKVLCGAYIAAHSNRVLAEGFGQMSDIIPSSHEANLVASRDR